MLLLKEIQACLEAVLKQLFRSRPQTRPFRDSRDFSMRLFLSRQRQCRNDNISEKGKKKDREKHLKIENLGYGQTLTATRKRFILLLVLILAGFCNESSTAEIPQWMANQINADLAPFRNKPISFRNMLDFYHSDSPYPILIKATIINNQLFIETKENYNGNIRVEAFEQSLQKICNMGPLPDVVLLISQEDGFFWDYSQGEVPIFAQSKEKGACALLLPDFEALRSAYQVLKGTDITSYTPKWQGKKSQLIWRGSTAQLGWRIPLILENLSYFSRVSLCHLSEQYPALINAKFTIFAQGAEFIPSLQDFKGDWISYKKQVEYKYHILIDGNVSSYTCSGWRFFINSLIFKPESQWIQWYYDALQPYVHYVPVEANLADLPQKIQWAIHHDKDAKMIAGNAREFALTHLTLPTSLLYLYYLIWEYSKLNFVD